jgi:hypothetical protein
VELRLTVIWLTLLGVIESTDALTTALGRARGAVESMPASAAILSEGGMPLYVGVKVLLVVGVSIAALLAARWVQARRDHSRAVYVYAISSVRVCAVALAIVSLNNAVLLRSLG